MLTLSCRLKWKIQNTKNKIKRKKRLLSIGKEGKEMENRKMIKLGNQSRKSDIQDEQTDKVGGRKI